MTDADLAVDRFLHDALMRRPSRLWLALRRDRGRSGATQRRRTFIVDPIDGTVAFLKGRPHFTICAAVVEAGRPLCGVVYNPMTEECFAAAEGGGARLNGRPDHGQRPEHASKAAGCWPPRRSFPIRPGPPPNLPPGPK